MERVRVWTTFISKGYLQLISREERSTFIDVDESEKDIKEENDSPGRTKKGSKLKKKKSQMRAGTTLPRNIQ